MISVLIFLPLFASVIVAFTGMNSRRLALIVSLIEFLLSLFVLSQFIPSAGMQMINDFWWVKDLGISYKIGVDGISMLLVLLTTFLVPIIIHSTVGTTYKNPALFYALILFMQSALIGVFSALDGFLFYIFWELALIPIYLICLMWGGKDRIRITLKFFIYTLAGSLLMLVALIWLWFQTPGSHTFDIGAFYAIELSSSQQSWIFWGLFLAFAVKMPVFPFHTWQPDTYTDAPSPGTMLLSGIMLKMGIYGVLRLLLPIAPMGVDQWGNLAIILSITGVVYASCIALVQKDFKRLVAYSSIAHVGLISAGIFSLNIQGLEGGVIQMISHGINVTGLFIIVDILQRRLNGRSTGELGGIRNHAPQFATYFLIILLASVALPLTNGFVGEFLLINGIFQHHAWQAAVAGLTIILGAVYMLSAYKKIVLGESNSLTATFTDLTRNEKLTLLPLLAMIFFVGIYPKPVLEIARPSIELLQHIILKK
jgi:NADH-quinone oxidoreductase subunit M